MCDCEVEIEDLNTTCGFLRPTMNARPCLGTVDLIHRHFFVCTGHSNWNEKIPEGETNPIQELVMEMKSRKKTLPFDVRVNLCDLTSASGVDLPDSVTIIVFPEAKEYKVRNSDLKDDLNLMLENIVSNTQYDYVYPLKYKHVVFICSHGAVDKRCGFCGPKLSEVFADRLKHFQLEEQVLVSKTSHVGGHSYAGNVIVYPAGDWYGYVAPEKVDDIINAAIVKVNETGQSVIIPGIWRGRTGLSKVQAKELGAN